MIRSAHLLKLVATVGVLCLLALVITACGNDELDDIELEEENPGETSESLDPDDVQTVEDLATLLEGRDAEELRGHAFEIDAWISPPPTTSGVPSTPSEGCPIVPEKQDWLSDEPVETQFEVAGASIPNERLAEDIPILRLVVPYTLGFVEVPEQATLRGYVLDAEHADCPRAESLFILDDVVEILPAERDEPAQEVVSDWDQVTSELGEIVLEYPAGWEFEEQDTGVSARIRFLGPDDFRTIRFEVHEGDTYWHPDSNGDNPPDVLGGDRRELAIAGNGTGRLVDDRRRTSSDERELRLVFNHQGRTIFLSMVTRDGAALDEESIWVFSEMAQRMHLQGDVAMSDPMDPILAASDEIGEGPFLSEADARYVALNASGMTGAETVEAELVSERDARMAVDRACYNFDGRPSGVWLVSVAGTTPSGSEAYRLVYLDAETGNRLCQTDAPGVS